MYNALALYKVVSFVIPRYLVIKRSMNITFLDAGIFEADNRRNKIQVLGYKLSKNALIILEIVVLSPQGGYFQYDRLKFNKISANIYFKPLIHYKDHKKKKPSKVYFKLPGL